jgi:serine/threonine-protein kinase
VPYPPDAAPLTSAGANGVAYRVTGVLGEGGMGVVYAAEQERPVRRRVAVKVLRAGLDASVLARFAAERQALALMEHPGIARVFDAGTTPEGRPYFVMEYVDGVPIGAYCDARALPTRARLRLFVDVCRAVQHAHQKGVIHRDLKPSNVLVAERDGGPHPTVIDFGIAKAVDRHLTGETLATAFGAVVGTPAYMSPEQAEGGGATVDTRADVYALGVMLYELLTGALPVDPSETGLLPFIAQLMARTSAVRAPSTRVTEQAPTRPDHARGVAALRATTPPALARELRGDLDAVVLKAIAPERERRYQSARELAEDLERHLERRPVHARAPSLAYRLGKLARRRPAAVALGVSSVAFLVGLSVVTTVQARRVARAREVAELRRGQAEELLGFMVGDLRGRLEPIGQLAILDAVGERALKYFAAVPTSELRDAELLRRAQTLSQIGQVRVAQGQLHEAAPAFAEALAQARDLAARDPSNAEWQVELGAAHFWAGYVHYLRGELDAALARFRPYLAISERLVARDSTNAAWLAEVAYARSNLGSVKEAQGDLAGALAEFRYSLGVKERLAARDTADAVRRRDLGNAHNTVGVVFEKLGPIDSARAHYAADLAIKRALAAVDPADARRQQALATALTFAASAEERAGRVSAAAALLDTADAISRTLAARDPNNQDWQRDLAASNSRIGQVELARGLPTAALSRLERARRAYAIQTARDSTNADSRVLLAAAERWVAAAHAALGDAAVAHAHLRAALALLEPLVVRPDAGRTPSATLAEVRLLEAALHDPVDDAAARVAREHALSALGGPRASEELRVLESRARALDGLGRRAEAAPLVARLRLAGYRAPDFVRFAAAFPEAGRARP